MSRIQRNGMPTVKRVSYASSMRATPAEILTLHRYFIWQNAMRAHFLQRLKEVAEGAHEGRAGHPDIELFLYMSYWYAGLYVVVEGWRELGLQDEEIDLLLESSNVDLLRRYRNGVFHFQRTYYDNRFLELMGEGEDVVEWVHGLANAFGRYFLSVIPPSGAIEAHS
jgi:hypothetical protein